MPGYCFLINGLIKGTSPGLSPGLSAPTALGLCLPSVWPVGGAFLVLVMKAALRALEGDSSWLDMELAVGRGSGFSASGEADEALPIQAHPNVSKAPALVTCSEHISAYQHQQLCMENDLELLQVCYYLTVENKGNGAFYDAQIGLLFPPRPIKGSILTPSSLTNLEAHLFGRIEVYERPRSSCVT